MTAATEYAAEVARVRAQILDIREDARKTTRPFLYLPVEEIVHIYVDDASGSDSASGTLGQPYKTISKALQLASADSIIYVKPGTYAENLVITTDYITLVGLHTGYGRPDIVPAAGVALTIEAQGVVIARCRFSGDAQDADVVQVEGNGFTFTDCVFDGHAGMAATKAAVRLWCDAADDSRTASEGVIDGCLFRGSPGYGLATDVQNAAVGVGPTHGVVKDCRFISNTAEDVIAKETAAGTYSIQDFQFDHCAFGLGTGKNKATHIDISTNNGATNTGNVFTDCLFNDDTINTTAIKAASTGSSFIGCFGLDGVIDGDALD